MSQPEDKIVPIKPFDTEQFLAHMKKLAEKQAEERNEIFLTPGRSGNDEERIRDAVQRERFWLAQPASDHKDEELAHCWFTMGKVDEALELAKNPERRAYYETIRDAIEKDDNEVCECEPEDKVVGQFPSAKHGGMTNIYQCPNCKVMNIR